MNNDWKHEMGSKVTIAGNESGEVVGRAEFAHSERSYYVRYRAGDGRSVESWWGESALTANPA